MKLLITILNDENDLESVLDEFIKIGIKGSTILDGEGMARTLVDCHDKDDDCEDINFSFLSKLMNPGRSTKKVILTILEDSLVEKTESIVGKLVGALDQPNTAVMFTMNINDIMGIVK